MLAHLKNWKTFESNFLTENRSRTKLPGKCVFRESSLFFFAKKRCTGASAGPCYCPVFQKKADFCATAISASCKIDVGTARRALFGQHRVLANIESTKSMTIHEYNTIIKVQIGQYEKSFNGDTDIKRKIHT